MWAVTAVLVVATAAILFAMDRPPICTCGTIKLWHGVVQSAENSQHIADWYTFSHIIHGFIFYGVLRWLRPRWSLAAIIAVSILIEGAWEIAENSPAVIDRYRSVTMAFGYSGDSILNSISDVLFMVVGVWIASRLHWTRTVALAMFFEVMTLILIRDNLTLNVLMLVAPIDAIRVWQGQ